MIRVKPLTMSCNCNQATLQPSCIDNLTIGQAAKLTTYRVYFKTPTGRIDIYQVTSDATGWVIVTNPLIRIGDVYEVWMNLLSATSINTREEFLVVDTMVTCLNVEFTQCDSELTDQMITLA